MLPAACNQKNDLMMKYVVEVIINNFRLHLFCGFYLFIYVFFSFFLLEKQEEDHLCSYM